MSDVPRKKQSRGEHTRRDILRAAKELLVEKGFEGVSVQAVIRRAHSSVGSFYHHFKNKEDLFMQVIGQDNLTMRRFLRDVRYLPSSVSLEERNIRAVSELLDFAEENRILLTLTLGETDRLPPKIREIVQADQDQYYEEQMKDLEKQIEMGMLPPFDVRLASHAILGTVVKLLQAYFKEPDLTREAVIDAMARSVVGIIRSMSGSKHPAYISPIK